MNTNIIHAGRIELDRTAYREAARDATCHKGHASNIVDKETLTNKQTFVKDPSSYPIYKMGFRSWHLDS